MLVSPLLPSFFDTQPMSSLRCKALCIIFNFLVLWFICLSSCPIQKLSRISYKGDCPGVYPFDEISAVELGLEKFSHSYKAFFSNLLFHLCLFIGVHFQYSQVLVIFLFSKHSDSFLIWLFYSFHYLSFFIFYYSMAHLSMLNSILMSWLHIFIVYIKISNSFSFFANSLMLSMYIM